MVRSQVDLHSEAIHLIKRILDNMAVCRSLISMYNQAISSSLCSAVPLRSKNRLISSCLILTADDFIADVVSCDVLKCVYRYYGHESIT